MSWEQDRKQHLATIEALVKEAMDGLEGIEIAVADVKQAADSTSPDPAFNIYKNLKYAELALTFKQACETAPTEI